MVLTVKPGTKAASKSKAVAKPTAKVKALTETQKLVNEYTHLAQTLKDMEVDPIQKRMAEVKSRLQSIASEQGHAQEVTLEGTEGTVTFSACREETVITDRDLMIKKLTPAIFVEVGKVGLTDIRKYLSAGEIQTFTEKQYGARVLKAYTRD